MTMIIPGRLPYPDRPITNPIIIKSVWSISPQARTRHVDVFYIIIIYLNTARSLYIQRAVCIKHAGKLLNRNLRKKKLGALTGAGDHRTPDDRGYLYHNHEVRARKERILLWIQHTCIRRARACVCVCNYYYDAVILASVYTHTHNQFFFFLMPFKAFAVLASHIFFFSTPSFNRIIYKIIVWHYIRVSSSACAVCTWEKKTLEFSRGDNNRDCRQPTNIRRSTCAQVVVCKKEKKYPVKPLFTSSG